MNDWSNIQHNKLMKLDRYNVNVWNIQCRNIREINTVHEIHNATSSHEKLFAGEHSPSLFRILYTDALDIQQYATNSLLFLRII